MTKQQANKKNLSKSSKSEKKQFQFRESQTSKKTQHGFFSRMFCIISTSILVLEMVPLFLIMLDQYTSDPISIGAELEGLQTQNTFPSISVCLGHASRIQDMIENFLKERNITTDINVVVKNIIFLSQVNPLSRTQLCEGLNATCGVDLKTIRKQFLPQTCHDFVEKIIVFNKTYHDCETILKPHDLPVGQCFLINNIIHYGSFDNLPLKYEMFHPFKTIEIYMKKQNYFSYQIYVQSPEEFPNPQEEYLPLKDGMTVYWFHVDEINNDFNVIRKKMDERKCKIITETAPGDIFHYSYSSCWTQLRINLELNICNCTLHTSPDKYFNNYCDIKGIKCVTDANVNGKIRTLLAENSLCYPSCNEQHITNIGSFVRHKYPAEENYGVIIEIINIKLIHLIRTVKQTELDLFISVTGVVSLILGISPLSIIEYAYLYLRRH